MKAPPAPISIPWRRPDALPWGRYPMVLPVAAVAVGILVAHIRGYPAAGWLGWSLVFLVAVGLLTGLHPVSRQRYRDWLVGPLVLAFVLLGYWRAVETYPLQREGHFSYWAADSSAYLARVLAIRPGEVRFRLRARIEQVSRHDSAWATTGQAVVYLPADQESAAIRPGDRLAFSGRLVATSPPANPGGFDFRAYWAQQYVYHQFFLRPEDPWHSIAVGRRSLRDRAESLRDSWIDRFRPYLPPDELAVASALVLGKRDLLSDELRSAYADTGAVHVLAVSGLHVGIVAWILMSLFGRLLPGRSRGQVAVRTLLAIGGVWGFALLTGFSPSVQRASIMFSLLLIGQARARRASLFNSLAWAALGIILVDPQQLFSVGFQLSFAAVAGIGIFQQPIFRLFRFTDRWRRSLWSVLSVSLAAQLGTLPLAMYYFQQFPLYFLLTGSLVILTAYGALVLGLVHGLVAWLIPPLAGLSGTLLQLDISLQNAMVRLGRQLPGAVQQLDAISMWQVVALYILIGLSAIWLRWRRWTIAVAALGLLAALLVFRLAQVGNLNQRKGAVAFYKAGQSLLEVQLAEQGVALRSAHLSAADHDFLSGGYRKQARYLLVDTIQLDSLGGDSLLLLNGHLQIAPPILHIHGQNWLFLPAHTSYAATDSSILRPSFHIHTVWVGQDTHPASLPPYSDWTNTTFLLDGSLKPWQRNRWLAWLHEQAYTIHDMREEGAFILGSR